MEVTASGLPIADWCSSATNVELEGRTLEVELPIVAGRDAGTTTAELVLLAPAGERSWPAVVSPRMGRMHLRSTSLGVRPWPDASTTDGASLHARLGPPFDLDVEIGVARLDRAGAIRVMGAVDRGPLDRVRRRLSWEGRGAIGRVRRTFRRAAVGIAVRLPDPLRRVVGTAYRRAVARRG